jgi:hypothetical protein
VDVHDPTEKERVDAVERGPDLFEEIDRSEAVGVHRNECTGGPQVVAPEAPWRDPFTIRGQAARVRTGSIRLRPARRLQSAVAAAVAVAFVVALVACLPGAGVANSGNERVGPDDPADFGRGVTTSTGQVLTPAGTQVHFPGRPWPSPCGPTGTRPQC